MECAFPLFKAETDEIGTDPIFAFQSFRFEIIC